MSKYDDLDLTVHPLDQFVPGVSPSPEDPNDYQATVASLQVAPTLPIRAMVVGVEQLLTRNQGGKGACAVFGGGQIFEHEARKLGLDVDVSEDWGYGYQQQLYGQLCDPSRGTVPRYVMKMLVDIGTLYEAQRPYTEDACRGTTAEEIATAKTQRAMLTYQNCGSIEVLKAALAANKMVLFCMTLYRNFAPDAEGLIPLPAGPTWGGHAMKVVGYDDTKFGGAFLVWNQWGSGWGLNGFCWITYEMALLPVTQGGLWWSDCWTLMGDPNKRPHPVAEEYYVQVFTEKADGTWDVTTPVRGSIGPTRTFVTIKRTRGGAEQTVVPFVRVDD